MDKKTETLHKIPREYVKRMKQNVLISNFSFWFQTQMTSIKEQPSYINIVNSR